MSLRWIPLLACLLSLAHGFEVTKNVNDGRPPVEKVLIFAKDKPATHLAFAGAGAPALAADGTLVAVITGSGAIAPRITWQPGDGRPAAFDITAYTYLIITCRLEGSMKETNAKGQVSEKRPDNLWFGVNLYNAAGERIGGASLADVNPVKEGVTPAETVELRVPLVMFHSSPLEDRKAAAIGSDWGPTRANQARDFRWVIDRIALAD